MTDMALFELIVTCAGVILLAAAAAAGMILGRKAAFAGALSGYGTPLALLLTLVLILLWRNEAAHSLWVSVLIFIAVPALFGAAAASLELRRGLPLGPHIEGDFLWNTRPWAPPWTGPLWVSPSIK